MNLSNLIGLIFYLTLASFWNASAAADASYSQVSLGAFSTDGSKLSIKFCKDASACKFGYVDLQHRRFVELFPSDKDQDWSPGGFSPNGQSMAISVRRHSEKGKFSQLGILSLSSSSLTQLTNGEFYKSSPSFSHDGKKLIFSQANRERTSGATRFSDWDVYEISVDGRDERRLTAYQFYQTSRPEYLPKDKQFIFSGDSPMVYQSLVGMDARNSYQNKHQDNRIFVLPLGQSFQNLEPYFSRGEFSSSPSISADGSKILYKARTDKEDGVKTKFIYDLFLFDGTSHRRMTRIGGQVSESVLSPKGDQAAFVAIQYDQMQKNRIYLLDIERGQVDSLDFTVTQ